MDNYSKTYEELKRFKEFLVKKDYFAFLDPTMDEYQGFSHPNKVNPLYSYNKKLNLFIPNPRAFLSSTINLTMKLQLLSDAKVYLVPDGRQRKIYEVNIIDGKDKGFDWGPPTARAKEIKQQPRACQIELVILCEEARNIYSQTTFRDSPKPEDQKMLQRSIANWHFG